MTHFKNMKGNFFEGLKMPMFVLLYYFGITFLFFIFYSWIGVAISLTILTLSLLIFLKWADKFILVFTYARYVNNDDELVNRIKNLCTHLKITGVNIYWTDVFRNNVYFTDSYLGKSAIIIGRNVYRNFSPNELTSLIYASLLRIKSREARRRTLISMMFNLYYFPVYLLRFLLVRLFRNFDPRNYFFQLFSYSIMSIKMKIYENNKDLLAFDQKVAQFYNLRKDYSSAIFKLGQLTAENRGVYIGELMVVELCHVQNNYNEVLGHLLFNKSDLSSRVRALNSYSQKICHDQR